MQNLVKNVYFKLLKEFGDLNWWPVISNNHKLEICLGAILTQSTNWRNVEKSILKLNDNNLIDAKKLKNIKVEELAQLIKSSGYYNQKAKKIKNFIGVLFEEFNGDLDYLFSLRIKELRNKLLCINGIGKETADSIILYAANKPMFVIDLYTKRIFSRLGHEEGDYDKLQLSFMKNLPFDVELFNQYHALLVELGKRYCKKDPECSNCPLLNFCRTGKGLNPSVF
ncbi:endonuclease III domain-containing protein [Candidatus Woesearchaeota archaeon]|nr:endonuclease III domain-containing protein [Candidatus Woesearchaeota archaeon]